MYGTSSASNLESCQEESRAVVLPLLFYRESEDWEGGFDFIMNNGGSVEQAIRLMAALFILAEEDPPEKVMQDFLAFCIDMNSVDS